MATNNAWNSTLTLQYAIQVGNSTGEIASIATGSANQLLMSGGAAANPAWSTATFPATSTIGDIIYASANNVWSDLAAGTPGQVLTMGATVPGWSGSTIGITSLVGDDTNTASGASVTITGGGNNVILTSGNNASTLTFNTPNITINAGINGNTGNVGIGFNTATISGTNGGSGSNDLVVIGYNAMQNSPGAGDNDQSVFIGAFAGNNAGLSGSCLRNTVIGYNSGTALNSTDNVLVGWNAGQVATGGQITVVGSNAGIAMTTDGNCDIFGAESGRSLAGSNFNQFFGSYAGWKITTGSNNVLIGQSAGFAYATGTESGNIILGGGINGTNGENNIMRLGNDGTGNNYATPTSQSYMAGVYGNAPAAAEFVIINASGQLGTSAGGGGGIATIDGDSGTASGATVDIVGTANEITTTGDNASTLTLSIPSTFVAPGSVEVTSGFTVDAGTITLTPLNAAGMVVNSALGVITTSATTNHAIQLGNASGQLTSLATGTSGQLLQSAGAADPAWTTATFPGTSVTGDLLYASGANTWSLLAPGTSGYVLQMGASVPAWSALSSSAVTSIAGTANEITASAATGAVTLSIPSTFIAPGSVEVTSGFKVDAGTITLTPLNAAGMVVNSALGVITTAATTANAVQVGSGGQLSSLSVATDGQVLLGDTASAPNWVTPTAGNGLSVTASDTVLAWALSAPVSIANGGTNATSMTNTDGVVYYDGTSLVTTVVGSAGQLLQSNGAGMAPTWVSGASGIGTIDGDSGTASGATVSILGTANQITTTGNNATHLTLSTPSVFIAPGSAASTTTTSIGTNLLLPTTTASTSGVVEVNGTSFMHSYGTMNTFLGSGSGNFTLTGAQNTCLGNGAGASLTTGGANTFLGQSAANAGTALNNSTIIGWAALGQATNTTETVVIGSDALSSTTGEADNSVYIGALVAENVTTAAQVNRNVVIGYNAAASWTTTSSLDNIYIGGDVTGANGENNTVRIGNQGTGAYQQNVAVIAGIYQGGGTQHGVLINSTGLLGTVVSSRRFKNSIEDMGDLSSDIYKLRPRKFLYNSRPEDGVQTGLIAEEVQEVMPQLAAYDSSGQVDGVKYHELPALLLNELQKLRAEVQELKQKLGVS